MTSSPQAVARRGDSFQGRSEEGQEELHSVRETEELYRTAQL